MNIFDAIQNRHSVRQYTDQKIENDKVEKLQKLITTINKETNLHIQLITGFSGAIVRGFHFNNVNNYIVMAGLENMEREVGYYGELVVLMAQMLGLNTCWVARTFNKKKAVYNLRDGEILYMVISLGYGVNQGSPHKSKAIEEVSDANENSPEWYKKGVEAALLAPTAINQQKFYFSLNDTIVKVTPGHGPRVITDLGIVQCHFDIGSSRNNFDMVDIDKLLNIF